jgi:hypothetical protein
MTAITIKEYYAASGSRFSKADAEIIGPALGDVAQNGAVTAQDVVDVARSSNSPLHRYFEWDNAKAANMYRVEQARNMLRSIKVKYVERGEERVTRAFQIAAPANERDGTLREYKAFSVLHGDRAVAVHMMRNALKELSHWRERYEANQDDWEQVGTAMVGIFNQVSEMEDQGWNPDDLPTATDAALSDLREWVGKHKDAYATWSGAMEQLRFLHGAIEEAERAFEFIERKHTRKCMSCKDEFTSNGPEHRMCNKCRGKAAEVEEYAI